MFKALLTRGQNERHSYTGTFLGSDTRIPPPVGETYVDDKGALSLSGAWRAVNMIVNDIRTMPLHAYVDGKRVDTPRLLRKPNPLQTRSETIGQMVYSLLMRGNCYCLLSDFDDEYRPQMLEVLDPDTVLVSREDGVTRYQVGNEPVPASEILHIKGLIAPGQVEAVSPISYQRQTIGRLMEMDAYGARNWTESAVPSVVITVDDEDLTGDEAAGIQNRWVNSHGRSRRPAVLPGHMKVEPLSFKPEDVQYLQSKEHSLQEIANIFNIPGYRLGAPGTSGTYQNAAQDELWYLKHTLGPWLVSIEDALEELVGDDVEVKFNADALLRMDTKSRYEAHAIGLDAGFLTTPEVREMENREPLPDGGLNVQALARTIQMIYLGVGKVISADEARDILNLAGADLVGSLEVPEVQADTPLKDAA